MQAPVRVKVLTEYLEIEKWVPGGWVVVDTRTGNEYYVRLKLKGEGFKLVCSCYYNLLTGRVCKHIRKVEEVILRKGGINK